MKKKLTAIKYGEKLPKAENEEKTGNYQARFEAMFPMNTVQDVTKLEKLLKEDGEFKANLVSIRKQHFKFFFNTKFQI